MDYSKKAIVFIAVSLDGFIAKPDGDIEWLSCVKHFDEDYGYHAFMEGIEAVVMGRKTYEKLLELDVKFQHIDKSCYVLTNTQPTGKKGNVNFYRGDLTALIDGLKVTCSQGIYIEGGGEVIHALRQHHLIDEYIISVIPILLGKGIQLFKVGDQEERLKLLSLKHYPSGLVQMHYQVHNHKDITEN